MEIKGMHVMGIAKQRFVSEYLENSHAYCIAMHTEHTILFSAQECQDQ